MDILGKKMKDLKLEVYEVTKGKYVEFFPQRFQSTSALIENVNKVSEDLTEAKDKIQNEVCTKFYMYTAGYFSLHPFT
jgi:hypothetical protein